jgi:hypothetical protein
VKLLLLTLNAALLLAELFSQLSLFSNSRKNASLQLSSLKFIYSFLFPSIVPIFISSSYFSDCFFPLQQLSPSLLLTVAMMLKKLAWTPPDGLTIQF